MRRFGGVDKVVLALLVVWVVCSGLYLRSVLHSAPFTPLGAASGEPGGYPVLVTLKPDVTPEESALRLGDRLVRVGGADLRGVGALGFYARYVAEAESGRPVSMVYERGGVLHETTAPRAEPAVAWPLLFVSFGFAFTAFYLSRSRSPSQFARVGSRAFAIQAIAIVLPFSGGVALNYAGLAAIALVLPFSFPLCMRAVLLFPDGEPPRSGWARFGPWCFVVMGPIVVSNFAGFPFRKPTGLLLHLCTLVVYFAVLLILIRRGYRRTDALGRRQIRWVVLGFYAALVPVGLVLSLLLADWLLLGDRLKAYTLVLPSFAFGALIPLSVLIAIARYNLFDVDRLLSATTSYNLVLIVLVGAGFALLPSLGDLSSSVLCLDPRLGQVAASLILAAIVVPAHHRLRPWIDGVLFKERYALDQGMAELLRGLATCRDALTLTRLVGGEIQRLLQPEACVVYAGDGGAYAPIFVSGRAVPPAFPATSPLVATLLGRHRPLALSPSGRRPDSAELGAFDRAALETLQAEVVLPVRQDEALFAFLCLAPKRSGDVYTSTDLAHLVSVAEAVSSRLRLLDQEKTLLEAREMQQSLRRYVPGAIAEQLASGVDLVPSRREVSVFFVDIRGYASFAETRRAEEIFSTVNRYTETVSEIVRRHGGAIVEFNGDGLMAVFGAPQELAGKERAAVEAGREIIQAVGGIRIQDEKGAATSLSVGLGIATGEAFVGNIRAADRMIWSAIGNTTNLAARLQALTRELDTALVIDAATWRALGPSRQDFERRPATAIRGRQQLEDIHLLRRNPPTRLAGC